MIFVMRTRLFTNPNINYQHTFYEFLFLPIMQEKSLGKSLVLQLPNELPKRFEHRILEQKQTKHFHSCLVKSNAFSNIEILSTNHIMESEGIWLCANDVLKKGGNITEGIDGKRTFFSVDIDEESGKYLELFCHIHKISINFPLSLYHGTKFTKESRESIFTQGLQETNGMLGSAVYLGTFWKACRFAGFTKDYFNQEGEIYRVLCFPKLLETFPRIGWICQCCQNNICDHAGLWRIIFDGVHVTSENEKGKLKNDEWGMKDRYILSTHVCNLQSYEYSPYKRNMKII